MEMKPSICPQQSALPKLALIVGFAVSTGSLNVAFCASPAPGPAPNSFVALPEWAKEKAFTFAWVKPGESFCLSNATWTLRFKGASPLGELNGVKVWLSHPVELRDGQPRVSALDLQTTLQPILFREARPRNHGKVIHTICLDPGHGGKDPGEKVGSTLEKTYTLLLAKELACRMRAEGLVVFLTRTTDTFVGLDDRPALANRAGSDLFISLHFNAGRGGECRGVEVYCLTPATARSTNIDGQEADQTSLPGNRTDARNVLLAYHLQRSLARGLGVEDRGLRRARFAVLRSARMPAVLIEAGFLSDPAERHNISTQKYRSLLAKAIVRGVLASKHAVES